MASVVQIDTPQNVPINFPLASVGERIAATLLDWSLFAVYYYAILRIFIYFDIYVKDEWYILIYLPIFFYHLFFEIVFNGQSLGKMALKLRVVRLDGSPPSIGSYLLRWLIMPIDGFAFGLVAIITALISNKGQRLGDLSAGTTVISIRTPVSFHDTIFREVHSKYQVSFPEVVRLSDKDLNLIDSIIRPGKKTKPTPETLDKLAKKVVSVLNIEQKKMSNNDFLLTILNDYNYLVNQEES